MTGMAAKRWKQILSEWCEKAAEKAMYWSARSLNVPLGLKAFAEGLRGGAQRD